MEEKQSRVRWDDQELSRLAAVMAPRLLADPGLHPLDAVRAAQECLEPGRRRELKAWSLVEGRLQPKLEEALAGLQALLPQRAAEEGQPQADSQVSSTHDLVDVADAQPLCGVPPQPVAGPEAAIAEADVLGPTDEDSGAVEAHGSDGAVAEPDAAHAPGQGFDLFGDQPALQAPVSAGASARAGAGEGEATATPAHAPGGAVERVAVAPPATGHGKPMHTGASVAVDPARIEAALVVALQSPVVEEALVELFARTMAKALLRVGTGDSLPAAHPVRPAAAQRVLLAGFPEAQQKALTEALGASFDVRSWKPSNGPQLFEALARLCKTVVFPEDADEEVDAGLKDMDVRVIRYAGNASRLIERIGELG